MATTNNNHTLNLRYILDNHKLSGTNFLDWEMNLRIVLDCERKLYVLDDEEPPQAPAANARASEVASYKKYQDDARDVKCIIMASMTAELQRLHAGMEARPMMQRLKDLYQGQARHERFKISKALFSSKLTSGSPVGPFVIKLIGMIETLDRLEAPLHPLLATDLILGSLPAEYGQTVVNFYMNKLDMTMAELLKFLTTAEESLGKKGKAVLLVEDGAKRCGVKPQKKNGKRSKNLKPSSNTSALKPKKGEAEKKKKVSDVYYHCGKKGHWRRHCTKLAADRKAGKEPAASGSA